nr:enoyl-CoA hydratase-related protein [Oceanicoccus sp. KOV_DT_Chl]
MACHFRLAEQGALLGLPEINLGGAPLWSGANRLLRLVGRANALAILLRGSKLTAQQAQAYHLINEVIVAENFDATVLDFANELAAKPPLAVAAIIRVINHGQDASLADALAYELEQFIPLVETKDMQEGVTALFEKREPVFIGM